MRTSNTNQPIQPSRTYIDKSEDESKPWKVLNGLRMEIFLRTSVVSRVDSVRWTVDLWIWWRRWSLKEIDRESVNDFGFARRCWPSSCDISYKLLDSFDDETDDILADNKSSLWRKLSVWTFRIDDIDADEADTMCEVDDVAEEVEEDIMIVDNAVDAAAANAALVYDDETLTVDIELPANDVKFCCFVSVWDCLLTTFLTTEHAFVPDSTISLIADDFSALLSVTPPPVVSFRIDSEFVFAILQVSIIRYRFAFVLGRFWYYFLVFSRNFI